MNNNGQQDWDLIIRPANGWLDLHLMDLWRYRDMVLMFVRRDFVSQFKQTLLGPAWFILQPLLTSLVFVVVFGNIAGLETQGLPKLLFYLSGNILWLYFSGVLTATSNTFISNAHLFGKVYFPRLAIPLSISISHFLRFGVQISFFSVFWIYYRLRGADIELKSAAALFPLVLVLMAGLALGLGILFSACTTKYRDLRFLLDFGVRLLLFASPVVYPLSTIPAEWRWFLLINPMTPLIEVFRLGFLGEGTVTAGLLLYSAVFSVLSLAFGAVIFSRIEKTFIDTV